MTVLGRYHAQSRLLPILISIALVAFLFWSTPFGFAASPIAKIILGLAIATFGFISALHVRSNSTSVTPSVVVAVLAISGLLIPALASVSPRVSLEWALIPMVGVLVFLAVSSGGIPWAREAVFVAGVATAIGVLSGFAMELWDWYQLLGSVDPRAGWVDRLPPTLPRVGFAGAHPNRTGAIGVILLPVAITLVYQRRKRDSRWGFLWTVVGMLLLGLMVLVSGSRGAWSGAIVAVASTLFVLMRPSRRMVMRILAIVLCLAGLLALIIFATEFEPEFLFRDTFDDRLPVMNAGWQMFLDNPASGGGPGSFLWSVDAYLGDRYPGVNQRVIWMHAHNGFVQALSELGLIGTGLLAGALALVIREALRRSPKSGARMDLAVVLGTLAGLALVSVAEVVSTGLSPLVLFGGVLGSAFLPGREDVMTGVSKTGPGQALLLLVFVPPVVALSLSLPAHFRYQQGVDASFDGRMEESVRLIQQADEWDSLIGYTRAELPMRTNLDEQVESAEFVRAASVDPPDPSSTLNALTSIEQPEKLGIDYIAELDGILPSEEISALLVAEEASRLGIDDMVVERDTEVMRMNPWMVDSPYWASVQGGYGRRDDAMSRAIAEAPCEVGAPFLLRGIDPAELESAVRASCVDSSEAVLTLEIVNGDTGSAVDKLANLVSATPDNSTYRRAYGLAEWVLGDSGSARRHWAIAAKLGDPWSALQLAKSYTTPPKPVREVVEGRYLAFTPVLRDRTFPLYRFGSIRFQAIYRRSYPLWLLSSHSWEPASTGLHEEMISILRGQDYVSSWPSPFVIDPGG